MSNESTVNKLICIYVFIDYSINYMKSYVTSTKYKIDINTKHQEKNTLETFKVK